MQYEDLARLRERLLTGPGGRQVRWAWLSELGGARADKKRANKFLLGATLDYQMPADRVWANARRFAEDTLGDPDDLWERVIALPDWDSEEAFHRYRLHRFPAAHRRVRRIGGGVLRDYRGDAREIWRERDAAEVLRRLEALGLGPQISRMVVGALHDTRQIAGIGQLKADLHVRRVLGRLVAGESVSVAAAHRIADAMLPGASWKLDAPLNLLGKGPCRRRDPECGGCPLRDLCAFTP